jgi:succinate dehydrogenase/fumarate reductase flavoprotein subunit
LKERVSFMEIIKTDILVIGGGGAGMRAALAAKEKGSEVLLASKTPIGKSTCTYLSGGNFAVAAEGVSKETHFHLTLQAGKGINSRELVAILVEEAPERIRELERFGLVGEWRKGRFSCSGKPPSWGAPLADILADAAQRQGVSHFPWMMVFDLLIEDGKAIGALAFDFRKGKPMALASKAVVMASGGGGALYRRHDNPVRTTGDGYALAFLAGCQLRDMEFVQFIPSGLAESGKPILLIAPSLCDVGQVINARGEDILKKYQITEKPVAVRARDSFSLAIFKEEAEGRDVFLDLRPVSEIDWSQDAMAKSQREILMKNFSGSEKPLRISPMCHHFMGGVVADPNGATQIPGLFAAGEVVGGVHGANRMGGNALDEILVFGYRAGGAAAEWAKKQVWNKYAESLINERWEAFLRKRGRTAEGTPPKILRKMIGEILWEKSGILRDEEGLVNAMESLQRIRAKDLPEIKAETPKEILERMEIENALRVGEMITRSALMRKESRGAHMREDFAKTDDQNWKGNIFLKKSEAGMRLEFRPLRGETS